LRAPGRGHRIAGGSRPAWEFRSEITEAFGKDPVIPIWNQVMSALRVPDKYKNGEKRARFPTR
jgi:hypothetical protein